MKSVVPSFVAIACLGVSALALGGCKGNRADDSTRRTDDVPRMSNPVPLGEQGRETTIRGANVVGNQSALDRIVTARCAREATCDNIGADKKYASTQECADKIKADMRDDLNAKECPSGIEQGALDKCLEAVRTEHCGNPIDVISRLATCRTGELCVGQ